VSEDVGNPLANLFKGVRGYWQPSDKFPRGYSGLHVRILQEAGKKSPQLAAGLELELELVES
jgi:hypothetical protein